ncbi:MAG: MATE family efflux transporter [Burkholderiaceae bacterium]
MTTPRFVTGAPMRHIVVMTSTAAFGLMGLFLVDLADMYFLSRLGEVELASAIGYAGSILFFTTSISIGVSIAMSANVARAIGARDRAGAERIAGSTYLFALLVTLPLSGLLWVFVPELLSCSARAAGHWCSRPPICASWSRRWRCSRWACPRAACCGPSAIRAAR